MKTIKSKIIYTYISYMLLHVVCWRYFHFQQFFSYISDLLGKGSMTIIILKWPVKALVIGRCLDVLKLDRRGYWWRKKTTLVLLVVRSKKKEGILVKEKNHVSVACGQKSTTFDRSYAVIVSPSDIYNFR